MLKRKKKNVLLWYNTSCALITEKYLTTSFTCHLLSAVETTLSLTSYCICFMRNWSQRATHWKCFRSQATFTLLHGKRLLLVSSSQRDAITSENGNDTLKKLFCMHKWTAMGFDIMPAVWNCSTLHSVHTNVLTTQLQTVLRFFYWKWPIWLQHVGFPQPF
jgi:hypothetical protein